ncbi:hypothetical protein QBC34DRAFT_493381 [Podospora aff. communis PSN243]|uniref:Uncharacterized protein n=1 Tax=Podospora aff. communis PSN243 TaxID=3040156 RepID=A0AAV9GSB7_9PEZI|nr:hypothetical protein QBC34DRAFT_493381 [Podospora aff. communis PSN243]
MTPKWNKLPRAARHVLRDGSHFTQKSLIGTRPATPAKGGSIKTGDVETTATHAVALNLADAEVQQAARTVLTKNPALAAEAAAADPEVARYIEEDLGIKIPRGAAVHDFVEDDDDDDDDEEEESDGDMARSLAVDLLANQFRLSHTSLAAEGGGRFSMVIAVTQGALNSQLFFRWADPERPELRTILAPAPSGAGADGFAFHDGEAIDADLAAPQLSLQLGGAGGVGGTGGSILFYLHFLGGVCSVWDTETQTLVYADDTFGWKFALEVDLHLVDLDKDGEEYRRVAAKYDVPGTYGISALVAELHAARATPATWLHSSFGGFAMTPSRRDSFASLVLSYLKGLSVSINYSLVDRSGTVLDPTLPPTSQALQTYGYRETTMEDSVLQVSDPVEGLGVAGDKNALLYLAMTRKQAMPASQRLPWSANWVTSNMANPVAGGLAISRADFIDHFLMPNLAMINKATYFEVTQADTRKTGAASAAYSFAIGKPGLDDAAYAWVQTPLLGPDYYTWTRSSSKSDEAGARGFQSNAKGKSTVANILHIEKSTNRISWTTTASLRLETSIKAFGIKSKGIATATRSGQTAAALASILDGKLSVEILTPPGWVKTNSTGSNSFGFSGTNMNRFADDLEKKYFDTARIAEIVAILNQRLQRDFSFVLPGGGNFLMKNPIFNENADLLVDLTYNGSQ